MGRSYALLALCVHGIMLSLSEVGAWPIIQGLGQALEADSHFIYDSFASILDSEYTAAAVESIYPYEDSTHCCWDAAHDLQSSPAGVISE